MSGRRGGVGRARQERRLPACCFCTCTRIWRLSRWPPRIGLYFLRPAPTCLPPAGAAAEGVHCMPRGHRPPPGTIRRWACAGPADRHWVARWSGAGRGLWWPCLSKPRIGPTGCCWGATGAINKPHGGSWVALSAGFGGMSVEMAVESPTDMLVRNLGGVRTKVSTQTMADSAVKI